MNTYVSEKKNIEIKMKFNVNKIICWLFNLLKTSLHNTLPALAAAFKWQHAHAVAMLP